MKSLLLSRDIVAVDTAGARLIGFPLETVAHITNGEKLGLGTTNTIRLDIRRIML